MPILAWILLGRLFSGPEWVFDRELRPLLGRAVRGFTTAAVRTEFLVLDIVYVLGVIALFVVIGVLGRAVEKL